jgi:phosphatidylinositol alpha-mannosyltransferase
MKIALVSPYDFAYPGGVVDHISSLEQQMTGMGHDVRIIAPASRAVPDFEDRFIQIGRPYPFPAGGTVTRVPISLRLGPTIKGVLAREKFDIIHLHEPFMPMLCSAVLRFSDAVNVGTFHACQGKPGYRFGWPVSVIMLTKRARNLNGRIAVSEAARKFANKYMPGDYEIIPNGIDLKRFSEDVSPIQEFCDGKKNILFVGRLEYRKGVDYLLKAYRRVKREVPESRLLIAGPGTRLRKKYETWVRKHHLDDVVFVGYVSYEDLPRYYKTADIFCSPATKAESFGIVLLEAMALGKPIVATSIDGYAAVVSQGEDGLLVPPKNSEALADTLVSLIGDEALQQRMGANGKLKARDYSWENVARRVFDYYGKVLGSAKYT